MNKNRSDAKLLNLPEEQQAKLADWLLGGMPYHEAKVLVEKEFGVEVRSLSAFSGFWAAVCQPAMLKRRSQMSLTAEARAEEAQKEPGKFDEATLDALRQKAYELAEAPNASPKDIKAVMTLLLKAQDQRIKQQQVDQSERRLALLEKKAAQFDAARGVMQNKELSETERAQRMRELFGMI